MKFVDDVAWKIWQLETEDGIYYRTNDSGSNWERLYGDSWETVHGPEEERCQEAWREYFSRLPY